MPSKNTTPLPRQSSTFNRHFITSLSGAYEVRRTKCRRSCWCCRESPDWPLFIFTTASIWATCQNINWCTNLMAKGHTGLSVRARCLHSNVRDQSEIVFLVECEQIRTVGPTSSRIPGYLLYKKNKKFEPRCKSSQVTNHQQCILHCAKSDSTVKNRIFFRDYGVAEGLPGFQAGWSGRMYFFSLFLFILYIHLELMQPRHSSPWDDLTTNSLRDWIYIRFSKRRFHPVSISTPLRAK
jgi:hypothetical protein